MEQPSSIIADRYRLQLSPEWRTWFDDDACAVLFPGAFREAVSLETLSAAAPAPIWAGFMLPDCLPIIGNDYGDWICARVGADNAFSELVYWYHGGGDWIPVGRTMQEAVIHDAVDQFRPVQTQMLRGAAESVLPERLATVLHRFEDIEFQRWLERGLVNRHGLSLSPKPGIDDRELSPPEADSQIAKTQTAETRAAIQRVMSCLSSGDYAGAVREMFQRQWAYEAAACDLIDLTLQEPIREWERTMPRDLQSAFRAHPRWWFDPAYFAEQWSKDTAGSLVAPQQGWEQAESIARDVLTLRTDLAWASDIAGWCCERQRDISGAAECYFNGRFASSFSNQAVRLRTHWFEQAGGKFGLARLADIGLDQINDTLAKDLYLKQLIGAGPGSSDPIAAAQAYWQAVGESAMDRGDGEAAYTAFYRAGWDLGVKHLRDYETLLTKLSEAAQAAGWTARSVIAQTHLEKLRSRM